MVYPSLVIFACILVCIPGACASTSSSGVPTDPPEPEDRSGDDVQGAKRFADQDRVSDRGSPSTTARMVVQGLEGVLSDEEISRGMREPLRAAESCFVLYARGRPYLGGVLRFRFTVSVNGLVAKLEVVEATVGNTATERCIFGALRAAKFSRPKGGRASFTYPLQFRAQVDVVQRVGGIARESMKKIQKYVDENYQDRFGFEAELSVTIYTDRAGDVLSWGTNWPIKQGEPPYEMIENAVNQSRVGESFVPYTKWVMDRAIKSR